MKSPVTFLGLEYASPLWAASGTYGWGLEAVDGAFLPSKGLGALVTKGVSPLPMVGAPQPRVAELAGGIGMLNAIGLQNPGLAKFLSGYVARYDRGDFPLPIWVNVFADSIAGFVQVIDSLRRHVTSRRSPWLAGFELNVSCPNVDKGGTEFGAQRNVLEKLVAESVAAAGAFPVMVKLSPMSSDPVDLAKACADAGARALSVANTMPAGFPILDRENTWALGRRFGGMSGPALKPIALRLVNLLATQTSLEICGVGGIQNAQDAREFFSAGARVVQVGTAHFAQPWICEDIYAELQSK